MFRRIQFKAKPFQTVFRRNFFDAEVKVPKRIQYAREFEHPSGSLGNGMKGQKIFPRGTLMKTVFKELPKAAEALLIVTGIMVLWPKSVAGFSKFINSVPTESTAAVEITPTGQAAVSIPQTYARLDKDDDDEWIHL